jgi:hypothetical protein
MMRMRMKAGTGVGGNYEFGEMFCNVDAMPLLGKAELASILMQPDAPCLYVEGAAACGNHNPILPYDADFFLGVEWCVWGDECIELRRVVRG